MFHSSVFRFFGHKWAKSGPTFLISWSVESKSAAESLIDNILHHIGKINSLCFGEVQSCKSKLLKFKQLLPLSGVKWNTFASSDIVSGLTRPSQLSIDLHHFHTLHSFGYIFMRQKSHKSIEQVYLGSANSRPLLTFTRYSHDTGEAGLLHKCKRCENM